MGGVIAWALALPAMATERWQVLVVGEASADTLPEDHPAWRSADAVISEALLAAGLQVYDKAALGLTRRCAGKDCAERDVAGYVQWARQADRKIDLIVIYNLTVSQRKGPAVTQWQVRLPARMVDTETAAMVDQWSGGAEEFNDLPVGCDDLCQRQWLAERAQRLAAEVGVVLTEKLHSYTREFVYRLSLDGLAVSELNAISDALRDEKKHRNYRSGNVRELDGYHVEREWLHSRENRLYEVRTVMGSGEFNQFLQAQLDDIGVSAAIEHSQREFRVARQGMPYLGRYISLLLLPLALAASAWLALHYRQHDVELKRLALARQPSEGLQALATLRQRHWPLLPHWRSLEARWQEDAKAARHGLRAAEEAANAGDFASAREALASVLEHSAGHPQARALLQSLPDREEARRLLSSAKECLADNPSSAAKLLTHTLHLDAALNSTCAPLLAQAQESLRRGLIETSRRRSEQALQEGHVYAALSAAGAGLMAIQGLDGFDEERRGLQACCDSACRALVPLQGPTRGSGLWAGLHVLVGDSVDIGRGSDPSQVSVGYKRASKLGKQSRIRRERGGLWIEDLESTNGSLFDGQLLTPAKPVRMTGTHELALGGERAPPSPGACRIQCEVVTGQLPSLVLRCDRGVLRMLDAARLAEAWPTSRDDLQSSWLLLAEPVAFALGESLSPAQAGETPVLRLGYDAGYYVLPVGDQPNPDLTLQGQPVTTRMPLAAGAVLSLAGRRFALEAV